MTFLSYAQNFEDVLLWRALGHIKNGFYIDVGANDPVEHSVTKAFYDAGWSGISIEPLPSFHQQFLEQRPRDINLAIAAGSSDGELVLYDVPAVRGWASPDRAVADQHQAEGYQVAEIKVPVRTLASVCAEHVHGAVHFLKIDVEGFEGEVLRGMDFVRWRPWVLVIEATLPNSRETNHEAWEPLVTAQRYRFAWFDGLNRYYVAEEHAELMDAFKVPPNVFDGFISHHLDKAWSANKIASEAAAALDQRLVRTEARRNEAEQRAAQTEARRYEADQRAERASVTAHEALAHARDLLARYDDARKRAGLAEEDNHRLRAELAEAERVRGVLKSELHNISVWAGGLEQRVHALESSTSWRVTRPLRIAGAAARALRRPDLARRVLLRVTTNERLRRLIIPVLLRFPGLRRRVSALLAAVRQPEPTPLPPALAAVPEELRALPAAVRGVLADLRRARSNQTGT
jgi:FkbM family methyltransferase